MTFDIIVAVLSLVATLLSCITAIFAIMAYCKVVGMEKSTHQIQWVDPTASAGPMGKDLLEKMAGTGMYEDEY